jgi:hypothetical protein
VLIGNHTTPYLNDRVDTGRTRDVDSNLNAENAKSLFDAKKARRDLNDPAPHFSDPTSLCTPVGCAGLSWHRARAAAASGRSGPAARLS